MVVVVVCMVRLNSSQCYFVYYCSSKCWRLGGGSVVKAVGLVRSLVNVRVGFTMLVASRACISRPM